MPEIPIDYPEISQKQKNPEKNQPQRYGQKILLFLLIYIFFITCKRFLLLWPAQDCSDILKIEVSHLGFQAETSGTISFKEIFIGLIRPAYDIYFDHPYQLRCVRLG